MTRTLLTEMQEMNEWLAGLGTIWVHLWEYRVTHGHAHVRLTREPFTRLADLYMADCDYIEGPTSGGPWTCSISEERVDGEAIVAFRAGNLTLKALRVRMEVAEQEPRER